jgi:hypothetical protein
MHHGGQCYWFSTKFHNKDCFERIVTKSHVDLICYNVVFVKYWPGLHTPTDPEALRLCVDALLNLVMGVSGSRLLIERTIQIEKSTNNIVD